jgi:23S rRNA (uracil1939-C5)-methyltransferase
MLHEVTIDKLVHGGQGIGTMADGKKALVWNVLPGETVRFSPGKSRSSYIEGVAEEILSASEERETPRDELYLSTSPWQMMRYASENVYKRDILQEALQRAAVPFDGEVKFDAPEDPWHYRNKMEYSFWGDDDGLHLALFNRGTHQKQIVTGSSIARPEIDKTANAICRILDAHKIRAGDLKSVVVRCSQDGETVAAIFTRNPEFPEIEELKDVCKGLAVYFSNPKSPASVLTRELYSYGDLTLQDTLLGRPVTYDVVSFFQGNLEAYGLVLEAIREIVQDRFVIDMYAGVGSIGLSVAKKGALLVEIDHNSVAMAAKNAKASDIDDIEVVHAASEKATEYITAADNAVVIFDPPRAGLHAKVTEAALSAAPNTIIYLSCNPSTLARDLQLLGEKYEITSITGYNFFPRTPHIEALAILEKKK